MAVLATIIATPVPTGLGMHPAAAATPSRFQDLLSEAERSRRHVEQEFEKFDGSTDPSQALKDAVRDLATKIDILRQHAAEHGFGPFDLSRIKQLCDNISIFDTTLDVTDIEEQIKRYRQQVKEASEAQLRWTKQFSTQWMKDVIAFLINSLTARVTPTHITVVQVVDSVLDATTPAGKPSSDPFVSASKDAITRVALDDFRNSNQGREFDPSNPNDFSGFVYNLRVAVIKVAQQRYQEGMTAIDALNEESTRRIRSAEARRRAKTLYLDLCNEIKRIRGWDPILLSLSKTASPPSIVTGTNTEVIFTIEARYTGPVPLIGVEVTDPDCSQLRPAQAPAEFTGEQKLSSGATLILTCSKRLSATASNTATLTARLGPGGPRLERQASTTVAATSPPADKDPPKIKITSHERGQRVSTPEITLAGTTSDDGHGNNGVWMTFVDLLAVSKSEPLIASGPGVANWSKTFRLSPGENSISVSAYDNSPAYNKATQSITIIYEPPEPTEERLVLTPSEVTIKIGEVVHFNAIFVIDNQRTKDVSVDPETRWILGPSFHSLKAGTFTVSAIYNRKIASASVIVTAANERPPDLTRTGDGPEGGLWNILFKPDGTKRPNCLQFTLAKIGGDRVSGPGLLTPLATREGWSVDTAGGAGPRRGWSWSDPKQANARMAELSVAGNDWYGCRRPPQAQPPRTGVGQVSPLPPGTIAYGIWRKRHGFDPPQCYQFHSAPLDQAARIDGRDGWTREPNYFGPFAQSDVGKVMSQLSRYGGDYYGCLKQQANIDREKRHAAATQRCRQKFGERAAVNSVEPDGKAFCQCAAPYVFNRTVDACITDIDARNDADGVCRGRHGPYAQAIEYVNPSTFQCACASGYELRSGQSQCTRKRTPQEILAEGHEACRRTHGGGAYATGVNANGTFSCFVPSRCPAGTILDPGTQTCVTNLAEGHVLCQQRYGGSSYATARNRDGSYQCFVGGGAPSGGGGTDCPPPLIRNNAGMCIPNLNPALDPLQGVLRPRR